LTRLGNRYARMDAISQQMRLLGLGKNPTFWSREQKIQVQEMRDGLTKTTIIEVTSNEETGVMTVTGVLNEVESTTNGTDVLKITAGNGTATTVEAITMTKEDDVIGVKKEITTIEIVVNLRTDTSRAIEVTKTTVTNHVRKTKEIGKRGTTLRWQSQLPAEKETTTDRTCRREVQ
jgi:hypothetical protein